MSIKIDSGKYLYKCPVCSSNSPVSLLSMNNYKLTCRSCKNTSEVKELIINCPSCTEQLNVNLDQMLSNESMSSCKKCGSEIYIETKVKPTSKGWIVIDLLPQAIKY